MSQQQQQDSVIKATARIQEAQEPPRQRPIIKLDARHQQELAMAHLNEADQLANTIRASIDSGRDNPFRPDGEIYKLTNPIVDYYKFGPNQSRSATPTYAELDYFSSKNKRKRKAAEAAARKAHQRRRPCWRRWLCCCCCCCCKRCFRDEADPELVAASSAPESANGAGLAADEGTDTARIVIAKPAGSDLSQARSVPSPSEAAAAPENGLVKASEKQEEKEEKKKTKQSKAKQRAKRVVLDEKGLVNEGAAPPADSGQHQQVASTTKVKTVRTSRCVVS